MTLTVDRTDWLVFGDTTVENGCFVANSENRIIARGLSFSDATQIVDEHVLVRNISYLLAERASIKIDGEQRPPL